MQQDHVSISRLTPRELEVARLVYQGLLNKEIARELGISQQTVKNHVSAIISKLSVGSRTEVARSYGAYASILRS
jgi:RNA polymerase sigma factor (sigma-70 family)